MTLCIIYNNNFGEKVLISFLCLLSMLTACVSSSNDPLEHPSRVPVRTAEYVLENTGDRTPDEYYRRALAFLERGELADAKRELTSELMQRSVDARYSFLLGKVLFLQGEYTESQKLLRDALELGFNQPEIYRLLSRTYIQLGFNTRALATADRLLDLDVTPDNVSLKANVLLTLGDTAAAVTLFESSLKQDSSIRDNYEGLLLVSGARKQYEKQGTLINAYLSREPMDSAMLVKKGIWLMNMKQYTDARSIFEELMSVNPRNAYYLQQHGRSYFMEGRYDSALIQARRALVLDETDIPTRIMEARSLENQRLFDEALEAYSEIVASDSTIAVAREGLERLERREAYLRYLRKQEAVLENIPPPLQPIQPGNQEE